MAACVGCSVLTISSMSDDESSPGSAVAASNPPSASTTAMNRPPLPQVKPPTPLNLADCSAKKWKVWKQTWFNYAAVSKIFTHDAQRQKALFLCTIGQAALEIYNAFRYSESEDSDRVETLISKFEEFFTEEVKETSERFEV